VISSEEEEEDPENEDDKEPGSKQFIFELTEEIWKVKINPSKFLKNVIYCYYSGTHRNV
jgi:hypothetical protein